MQDYYSAIASPTVAVTNQGHVCWEYVTMTTKGGTLFRIKPYTWEKALIEEDALNQKDKLQTTKKKPKPKYAHDFSGMDALEFLGGQGWELISVKQHNDSEWATFYFKRPKLG